MSQRLARFFASLISVVQDQLHSALEISTLKESVLGEPIPLRLRLRGSVFAHRIVSGFSRCQLGSR